LNEDVGLLSNVSQMQEVGDFGDENCLPTLNPACAGHKALFNHWAANFL